MGHNVKYDIGAVGIRKEDELNKWYSKNKRIRYVIIIVNFDNIFRRFKK